MPPPSSHLPQFPHFHNSRSRSQSPKPSPGGSRGGAAISLPPRHDPYPTTLSRPSSRLRHNAAEMGRDSMVAGPSRPSSRRNAVTPERFVSDRAPDDSSGPPSQASRVGPSIYHQNSTAHLVGDRATGYFNARHQPPRVSHWPVTPSGFVPPTTLRTPESHSSSVQQHTFVPPASYHTNSIQTHQLLASPPPPATLSQHPFNSDSLYYPSQPQHQSQGMFKDAHDFKASGTFVDASNTYHNHTSNQFMEKLLKETILGAEFDSSARDPPPRCYPGTRLDILERCLHFVRTCNGKEKTRWVVGAAGVGKSAIMQSVVESPGLAVNCHASVFFSINGRDDGTKAVATISYQLAVKSELYRQLIEREITRDPALLRSSMAKQFLKLIVEPFIHNPQLNSTGRALIVIDGLDECKNPHTQLEVLQLISDLCIKYPSSPLVWLIASRPEHHITAFFSQSNVAAAFEKEEIAVNSDKAREDVERYLRDKLNEIKKKASDTVDPRWPEERDLWKLANAAGGLFAYADTAVRYIGDTNVGSPASQISDVLNVIDNHPMTGVPPEDHPMALLDALYARILSNIPSKVMMNTRKLLLALSFDWLGDDGPDNFVLLCNWLCMAPHDAYAALNRLRSVLYVPRRDEAHKENLELFHKSFMDYISDFRRSGFSHDIKHEAEQLKVQCAFRILREAPDGIDFGNADYRLRCGILRQGPGTGAQISVAWPVDEDVGVIDNVTRLKVYKRAIQEMATRMAIGKPGFRSEFCRHILSTRFEKYDTLNFPFESLRDMVFDESRRQEFMMHGILKEMPLKAVDVSARPRYQDTKLQFRRPATTATNLSDPWNTSCKHERKGKWEERGDQNWETSFFWGGSYQERLERHLEDWKTRSPDHAVPTFFTSTGWCGVEFRFVDPQDGIMEWIYRFWVILSLEERKKYGSTV